MRRTALGNFIFGVLLVGGLAVGAAAQEKQEAEAYSGVAVETGGTVGGKSMQFDFRITGWTTE